MTVQQPRLVGTQGSVRQMTEHPTSDCVISTQALCHGPLDSAVLAVTGAAARPGREHIAIRFGRILIFLEDRIALEVLAASVRRAEALADKVFGETDDAFTQAERHDRKRYE